MTERATGSAVAGMVAGVFIIGVSSAYGHAELDHRFSGNYIHPSVVSLGGGGIGWPQYAGSYWPGDPDQGLEDRSFSGFSAGVSTVYGSEGGSAYAQSESSSSFKLAGATVTEGTSFDRFDFYHLVNGSVNGGGNYAFSTAAARDRVFFQLDEPHTFAFGTDASNVSNAGIQLRLYRDSTYDPVTGITYGGVVAAQDLDSSGSIDLSGTLLPGSYLLDAYSWLQLDSFAPPFAASAQLNGGFFELTLIPEPASFAVLALGGVGVLLRRR